VTLNLATREAVGPGGALHFTPIEYRILSCLANSHGLVTTQDRLIREVWGPDRVTDTRGLRTYIRMLRQKLEADPARPQYLVTEPGVGYRLYVDT
jgi:two-component system KDP operon response regulator KdpE